MNRIILPDKKYAKQTFLALYGINHCTANKLVGMFNLHPRSLHINLNRKKYRSLIKETLASLRIEHRLRLIVFSRMLILLVSGAYRGLRLAQGLPSHGQRTHANGKSLKRLKKADRLFPFSIKMSYFSALKLAKTPKDFQKPKKSNKPVKKSLSKKQKDLIKFKNIKAAKLKKKARKLQ
jgi:ribosomal protein S13